MDKEKFEQAKETLRKLLAIQQQHSRQNEYSKKESDKIVYERLDGLIVEAAADLIDVFADEREEKPVKSEMPCNCNCVEKPKILQEIINDVKAQLTDNQTYAVIVFRVDDTDTR